MRIAVLDDLHQVYDVTAGVRRLRERADVDVFTRPVRDLSELRRYDGLIANRERTRFDRAFFAALPDLRIIAQTGNHAYHVDLQAAHEHGVVVGKASGGFCTGAAELAIGLAIAVMRDIPRAHAELRGGRWPPTLGRELHGKTMGIVGLGHVGSHVAGIAAAFGMEVLAWSRRGDPARAANAKARLCDLDTLVATADVVSIHATLGPETRGLIDERRIALMKPTAYLINTARGAIVDEQALVAALSRRAIAGAALDVFEQEPLPPGHPLTTLPNVVLTPHLGWPTDRMYEQFAHAAADVLIAYLDGSAFPTFDRGH